MKFAVIVLLASLVSASAAGFPIGANLAPLGGKDLGGQATSDVNWTPISTYVFIDLYKHCSKMYIRQTYDGGKTYHWQPDTAVKYDADGYPTALPYTSKTNFFLGLCEIGVGGDTVRGGQYSLLWDGDGAADVAGTLVSSSRRGTANAADVSISITAGSTTGIMVRILESRNVLNPVRNLRLVPSAFEHNYTQQIFHPTFLSLLQPFDHLRFTGWHKISSNSKNWTLRTKPSSQTQHLPDGVAMEHMIDLLTITGIRSIAISFPLNSDAYNSALINFLALQLPSDTLIYFEAGSPEFQGDSNRAAATLALIDRFDAVFGSIQSIRDDVAFTWRSFASVVNPQYVPYLISWFGNSLSRLNTVAIPAIFGRSSFAWDFYNDIGIWNLSNAEKSVSELVSDVESSVFVAELDLNRMIQRLRGAHPSVNIIAYSAGPFFIANNYGYRAGKFSVQRCAANKQFPCTWANTKYNFLNQTELNAALPMMDQNATLEQQLENRLIEVQRNPRLYDIYLDFLHRWDLIGGGLVISSYIVQPVTLCPSGGKGCGNAGVFERPPVALNCSRKCPKYSALVDYNRGVRSSIPFTSADLPIVPDPHACSSSCDWGTCQFGHCVCFAGYTGASCNEVTTKRTDCNSDVGINLAGIFDWSTEWTYVDIFKSAREWISQDFWPGTAWNTATHQQLSGDYPSALVNNQKLGSMMIRDLREHIPSGVYVVLYDGDGVLTFGMDVVAEKRRVGRIEVTLKPSSGLNNGLFLVVERTNPLDPIRNIRVFMPGYESWPVPFHPHFVESIKNYKVLRFMDWANTNGAEYSRWSQRSTRNSTRSYSGAALMAGTSKPSAGAPIEDMILLSNMLGAAPWFNMPHLADDDFVRQYAILVRQLLRPDVKIYIEYSNEVWGTLFKGGQYAQAQGYALGFANNDADSRFCFYAKRSSEMFAIWKTAFGTDSSRLEFVYGSQSVNADVTRRIINCGRRLRVAENATVIAVAPYFGSYEYSRDKKLDIFMNTTLPAQIAEISSTMKEHFAFAAAQDMRLVTYESGLGLQGSGKTDDLAIIANRDSRMSDLYVSYYDMLRASNVSLMMQYTSAGLHSTSMCWGLIEASDQDPKNAPKYIGLQAYINKHSSCDMAAFDNAFTTTACSFSGLYVKELDRCECYYGSSGLNCQNATYTEHFDLCGYFCYFNQGDCEPRSIVGSERYWGCSCHEGYYGHQCALFDCKDSCNYNGKCLDKDICSCYPGFTGKFCEIDCGCNGNGACNADKSGCTCDVGFKWSSDLSMCTPLVAVGDGVCNDMVCLNGACIDNKCTCFAGYSGDTCETSSGSRPNQFSQIGTNLAGIAYWTTQWSFVDVMKMSSDWFSLDYPGLLKDSRWGNGMPIHLRDDGYPAYLEPGQILGKLMLRDVHYHAPAGRYTCLFDGDGVIDFGFDAKTAAIGKNRVEFMFSPTWKEGCTSSYCGDNGLLMTILKTSRSNPIRNIRVIMPGFEAVHEQVPFHPWFLQNIEPYSVLRYMDWQHTNGNTQTTWAKRVRPTDHTQATSGGVAIEHMIQLSNIVGAAPWFCMPHQADDDYVRQFAIMIRDKLRKDLPIYVEYSNEVWNGLFAQATYASKRGIALNLSSNEYTARYRFHSMRSVQIFNIWRDVFGTSSTRLKRVLSTFTVSPSATREILSWNQASSQADFLGIAGYFDCGNVGGPAKAGYTAVLSPEALLTECNNTWSDLANMVIAAKSIAAEFGLPVITYEAGQSMVETNVMQYGNGETAGLTDLFIATNRHPGMADLYIRYMQILSNIGIFNTDRPLMTFSSCGMPSKYGSWGTIEYTGQPISDTPKYQALMRYFNSPQAACRNCVSNAISLTSYLQTEKYTYAGFPAVLSPRYNDVWISGGVYTVTWSADTKESQILVYIHQVVPGTKSTEVWSLGHPVSASLGTYSIRVPPNLVFDGNLNYVVELRGQSGSNYSDVFSIQSKNYFRNVTYVCCLGDIIPSFDDCLLTNRSARSNVRYHNSSWTVNYSATRQPCSSQFAGWESSACSINAFGCREYRTSRTGSVYGRFKPVIDCVARTSPYPTALVGSDNLDKISGFTMDKMAQCVSLIDNYQIKENSCPLQSGLGDKRCDIPDPTHAPTTRPTLLPTAWPTVPGVTKRPTRLPSRAPTSALTSRPSSVPTLQPIAPRPGTPTRNPTLAPTALTVLRAEYQQNLDGITMSDFKSDPGAQNAFKQTVAVTVGTNSTSISINNITENSSARLLVGIVRFGIKVDYSLSITIQEMDTQDFNEALSLIQSRLTDSVNSGDFVRDLIQKVGVGSRLFDNCTVSAPSLQHSTVNYMSPPPVMSPTFSPSDDSSSNNGFHITTFFIIVAVIVVGIILCVVTLMLYWCVTRNGDAVHKPYRKVQVSPRVSDVTNNIELAL